MPTSTYDLIASTVLGTGSATVTFSSIPSTYRDLVLVMNCLGTSTSVNTMYARFNSDSGNNYFGTSLYGTNTNTVASASNTTGQTEINISDRSNAGFNDTRRALYIVNFIDYSATNKHKTLIQRANSQPSGEVVLQGHRWANTSAINRIDLTAYGQSFAATSTFYLYGIVS